jgi:MFS family permease
MYYFIVLYLCNFLDLTIGNGIFPLLPVYAAQFGATPGLIGIYLACANIAIVLGSILGGWLSDHLQKRKLLYIICTILNMFLFFLVGRVTSIWQLILITAIIWFAGGIKLTMLLTLLGLYVKKSKRRSAFLILTLTGTFGVIVGGLTFGLIADIWSYPSLFNIIGLSMVLLLGLTFFIREIRIQKKTNSENQVIGIAAFPKVFYKFLLINTVAGIGASIFVVGRSIVMYNLNLTSTNISHTSAIGAIVSVPLILTINWLFNHFSHKKFLVIALALEFLFLIILGNATSLWHFWLGSILMVLYYNLLQSAGKTITTDLIPKKSLGKGLSFFATSGWIGFIIGPLLVGFGIEKLGFNYPFYIALILPIVAFIFLWRLKIKKTVPTENIYTDSTLF